jgi:hypothetical protein
VRNAKNFLIGKPERNKQLGRTRRKLEDNIKIVSKKLDGKLWTVYICLRLGTRGRLF